MNSVIRFCACLLLFIGIAIAWYHWSQGQGLRILPVAQLKTITGAEVSVPSNKLTWVNVWSINCPPCVIELPALERIQAEYAQWLDVVALAAPQDPPNAVIAFKNKMSLQLPVVIDVQGNWLAQFDQPLLLPSHYLISPTGELLWQNIGALSESAMREVLERHRQQLRVDV